MTRNVTRVTRAQSIHTYLLILIVCVSDDTDSTIIDVEELPQAGGFVGRWWKGEYESVTTLIFNKERQDWTYPIFLDRGGDYTQPRAQYVFRVYGKWLRKCYCSVV